MLTIRPYLCFAMTAATALEKRNVPFMLTLVIRSQSSGVVLATLIGWVIPAMFARMSMRPHACSTASTMP